MLLQEAKLEGRRQRLKRYEDYLKGSSSAADPERDDINDLLNRHVPYQHGAVLGLIAKHILMRNQYCCTSHIESGYLHRTRDRRGPFILARDASHSASRTQTYSGSVRCWPRFWSSHAENTHAAAPQTIQWGSSTPLEQKLVPPLLHMQLLLLSAVHALVFGCGMNSGVYCAYFPVSSLYAC